MNEYPFRRSRFWGWLSVFAFVAMPLVFTGLTLRPYFRSQDWAVPVLPILMCAAALLTFGFLSYLIAVQLLTSYGKEGVRQPSLLGTRFLAWHEVREVRNLTNVGMELVGPEVVIPINFSVFEDRRALVEGIRARIPASAYPEPGKRRQEEHLRRQNVLGFSTLLNVFCVIFILALSSDWITAAPAILFLALAIVTARRWIQLRNSQP